MTLKPCPFCGGTLYIRELISPYPNDPSFYMGIHYCKALGFPIETKTCDTHEEVALAWNHRKSGISKEPDESIHTTSTDPPIHQNKCAARRKRRPR